MKALQSAHSVSGIFNMSEEDNLASLNENLTRLKLSHLETQLIRPRTQRVQTTNEVLNHPELALSTSNPRSLDRYNTISYKGLAREDSQNQKLNEVEYYEHIPEHTTGLGVNKVKITQIHKRGRRGGKKLKKRLDRLKKSQKKKFNKAVETIIYQSISQKKRLNRKKQKSAQTDRGDCKCIII
jgi:hypothetical protein